MHEKLKKLYEEWSDELLLNCSALSEKDYSNPCYVSIPEGWETAEQRIMIVGEEGYGEWGCGKAYGWDKNKPAWTLKDIAKIQDYNRWAIDKYATGRTAFWRRFKQIKDLGLPCIWNNLDKIHFLKKRKGLKHQLTTAEEQLLHSTEIKVLQEEIDILKPTVVVFFGWYYHSLVRELPEICHMLYPKGERDDSLWKYKVYKIKKDNITYIFTYHPAWHGKNKPKTYEEDVLQEVKNAIQI
jgi:hypothetical protein